MAEQHSTECIFCKFAKKEIEIAAPYEDEHLFAMIDINPAGMLVGHTLVIPKKHYNTIEEIDDATLKAIILAIKKLVPAIQKISEAEGINIIQNNGKVAGQAIMHAHFHIIPRKHGDGIRFEENRRKIHPMEQLETAKRIKEALGK